MAARAEELRAFSIALGREGRAWDRGAWYVNKPTCGARSRIDAFHGLRRGLTEPDARRCHLEPGHRGLHRSLPTDKQQAWECICNHRHFRVRRNRHVPGMVCLTLLEPRGRQLAV